MSRLRDIFETAFGPKPSGEKRFWKDHGRQVIDNRDPKVGGRGDDPAGKVKVHDRSKYRQGYRPDGEDERAYDSGSAPDQMTQGKPGLVQTSLPQVTTQAEWTDPYMQPVSDPTPAGGWKMRFKLQECQRTVVNLATAANLRLELAKEEPTSTIFRFASVSGTHPACNSPDLLIRNLQEQLKDTATIQEIGRRTTIMEPENKLWDCYVCVRPANRGDR